MDLERHIEPQTQIITLKNISGLAAHLGIRDYFIELGALGVIEECLRIDHMEGKDVEELFHTATDTLRVLSLTPSLATIAAASLLPGTVKQLARFVLSSTALSFETDVLDESLCAQITSIQLFTRSRLDYMPYTYRIQLSIVATQDDTIFWDSHELLESKGSHMYQFGTAFDGRSQLMAHLQVGISTCILQSCSDWSGRSMVARSGSPYPTVSASVE